MDSITPIISILPPTLAFLIFTAVLFFKFMKKKEKATMYFMFCFLCIGVGYGGWFIRSVFYLPGADAGTVFFWFKFAYMATAPFCTFLALAALHFLNPQAMRKPRNLILFPAPIIILEAWTFFSVPSLTLIAGQNDAVWPESLSWGYAVIGGFYLAIANYVFLWFLIKNQGHHLYGKVLLIEIGLIFFAIGTIIESSKIGIEYIGQLWLFVRWFTALGALVMLYGYLKK